MEDNAKCAYIASFIQGLPFAHKNVVGITQIIEEFTRVFNDENQDEFNSLTTNPLYPATLVQFMKLAKELQNNDPENVDIVTLLNTDEKDLGKLQHKLGTGQRIARTKDIRSAMFNEQSIEGIRAVTVLDCISTPESMAWLKARAKTFAQQIPSEEWAYSFRNRFCIDHPGIGIGLMCADCTSQTMIKKEGDHLILCHHCNVLTIATRCKRGCRSVPICRYSGY